MIKFKITSIFAILILVLLCFPGVNVQAAVNPVSSEVLEARKAIWAFDYVNSSNEEIKAFMDKYGKYIGDAVGWSNIRDIWGPGYDERAAEYRKYWEAERDERNEEFYWEEWEKNQITLDKVSSDRGIISDDAKDSSGVYRKDGYSGSHKDAGKYSAVLDLSDSSGVDGEVEKEGLFDMVLELFGKLIYYLANSVDKLLSKGGMALDNIIFGRVGGYGVKVIGAGSEPIVSFFSFELSQGNPYGTIAAALYQKVRSYIYIVMVLYCMVRLIRVGVRNDYQQLQQDRNDFIENALLSFSLIVLMPYFLDLYLYIRDILLKGVALGTLNDFFSTTGFLEAFRDNAKADYDLVPCLLYLGAVIASLLFAGIYVSYAMAMTVNFVLFPAVCLKAIGNKRALSDWVSETVGLTIMPIVDGMLLMIPLSFSTMGRGVMVMQLLSLIACAMLLTARKQARRTLGIRENNGLEMGALASVMGAAHLAKGVSNGLRRSVGRIAAGAKSAHEDYQTGKYYDAQAEEEGEGLGNTEGQTLAAPVSQYKVPTYAESMAGANAAGGSDMSGQIHEGASQARSTLHNPDPIAEKFANVNNFESSHFDGKLSNTTMGDLYKRRALKTMLKSTNAGFGAAVGGVAGGLAGFGAGIFMGSGMQSYLTGTGINVGSSVGSLAGEGLGSAEYGIFQAADKFTDKEGKRKSKKAKETGLVPIPAVESLYGTVDEESMPVAVQRAGGAVAEPQKTQEQMRQEYEVYQTHQFLFNEDGGKNMRDYSNAVSEGGYAAEGRIVLNLEAIAPVKERLDESLNDYNAGNISKEVHIENVEACREQIQKFKEGILQRSVLDEFTKNSSINYDENNEIHRNAANIAYMSSYKAFSEPHRLLSDEFTKEKLGIDFTKYQA